MSSDKTKKNELGGQGSNNDGFPTRLKSLHETLEDSQRKFADKIDFSDTSIINYIKHGTQPPLRLLSNIASAYPEVNTNWLLTGEGEMFASEAPGRAHLRDGLRRSPEVQVPIYGVELGAGAGAEPSELIVGYGQFFERWLRQVVRIDPDRAFICAVRGDSMTELFEDGDLVLGQFIDDPDRIDREGVYAVRHQGDLLIKRLRIGFDHLTLLSESDAYPNISVQPNAEDFEVIGQIERKIVRLDLPV